MSSLPTRRPCPRWTRLGALALLAVPAAQAADRLGGHVALTSEHVWRGVSQSGRAPALQADLHWRSPQHAFVGAWASTADPPPGRTARHELNLYAGRGWNVGEHGFAALRYARYLYPDSRGGRRYDWDEFAASLHLDDRLVIGLSGSPNTRRYSTQGWSARRSTHALEISWRQPLAGELAGVAAVGHYGTRALFGASYRAWHVGLAARLGPLDATLTRFGTDGAARRLFAGDGADGRWVLGAVWRF